MCTTRFFYPGDMDAAEGKAAEICDFFKVKDEEWDIIDSESKSNLHELLRAGLIGVQNLTDICIRALFYAVASFIEGKHGELKVDTYINACDSHFFVTNKKNGCMVFEN